MKKVLITLVLVSLQACAGMGIEGKLGLYREDVRQQSSKTFDKPLKCLFVSCNEAPQESGS